MTNLACCKQLLARECPQNCSHWLKTPIERWTIKYCSYFVWDTIDAIINYTDFGFIVHGTCYVCSWASRRCADKSCFGTDRIGMLPYLSTIVRKSITWSFDPPLLKLVLFIETFPVLLCCKMFTLGIVRVCIRNLSHVLILLLSTAALSSWTSIGSWIKPTALEVLSS